MIPRRQNVPLPRRILTETERKARLNELEQSIGKRFTFGYIPPGMDRIIGTIQGVDWKFLMVCSEYGNFSIDDVLIIGEEIELSE